MTRLRCGAARQVRDARGTRVASFAIRHSSRMDCQANGPPLAGHLHEAEVHQLPERRSATGFGRPDTKCVAILQSEHSPTLVRRKPAASRRSVHGHIVPIDPRLWSQCAKFSWNPLRSSAPVRGPWSVVTSLPSPNWSARPSSPWRGWSPARCPADGPAAARPRGR